MGLTNFTLRYIVDKRHELGLHQKTHVLDIGLSELHCHGDDESLIAFIHAFDRQLEVTRTEIVDFLEHCYLYDVCQRFGIRYTCYEVCGERPFTFFDFNQDTISIEEKERYDLILNLGTSEHIINQYNFFKSTHTLCSKGGIMLHILPFSGYLHHGFFNYQPKFFFRTAEENEYTVMDFYVADESLVNDLDSIVINNTSQPDIQHIAGTYSCSQASIHIALRKDSVAPFKAPIDHVFIGVEEKLKTGITIGPNNEQTQSLLSDFPHLAARTICIWDTRTQPVHADGPIPVRPAPRTLTDLQSACSTLVITDPDDPLLSALCQAGIIPCVEGNVLRSILSGRMACMPASGEVISLLEGQPEVAAFLQCVFDNHPSKAGTTLGGLPIKRLPEASQLKESIDIVVVASEAYKLAIMRQLEPFQRQGGKVITKQQFIRMTQDLCGRDGQQE
ncbi:MAG: hypothetical protein AB9872_14855 [Solidesulfovibrio sp.]